MIAINGKTRITGLIGYPVEHTKSPAMHNSAYKLLALNYVYIPLEVHPEKLQDALNGVRALSFAGVNVTIPYKEAVIPFLDELSKEASLIGAVNTIKNADGKLIGYNTDGTGFVSDVEEQFSFSFPGRSMLILGSGGAARAIAVSSLLKGIKSLMLVDVEEDKAKALSKYLKKHFVSQITYSSAESAAMYEYIKTADLIVNATPVGMHPNEAATPLKKLDQLSKHSKVYDIIYNPLQTTFLAQVQNLGIQCSGGLGMLAGQGAVAFRIFTGVSIETRKMIEFLHNA